MKLGFACLTILITLVLIPANQDPCAADIISFVATGSAGDGLLEGNIDPATGEVGTGGIGSTGITFNTDNNLLHIDIEWGSANGYTDLSQDVFKLHLHGPTASSGDAAFGEVAPLLIALSGSTTFDGSAGSGGVNDNFLLDSANVQHLLDGRTYINVHLSDSDTGMIRGYLQRAVPEPSSMVFLCSLGMATCFRRRR
ncbi:MAG: CHRD domain-containing protein [Mariniblastus sp.]